MPRATDLAPPVLLGGLGLAQVVGLPAGDELAGPPWLDAAFVVLCAAPLYWRRRAPGQVLLAVVLANLLWTEVAFAPAEEVVLETWFMMLVALWSVVVHGRRADLPWAAAGIVVELVAGLLESARGVPVSEQAVPAVSFVVTAAAAWALRRQRGIAQVLAERTLELEHEREARARESAELERARIARELHDLVTHAMTAVVLHASAERERVGAGDPGYETLRSIEELSRTALVDLRRSLGLLRSGPGGLAPQPTLAWLPDLVETARAGGMEVDVEERRSGDLDPAVDLNAFRITQEAVTNALKHAPGSRLRVEVVQDDCSLRVSVENGPSTPRHPLTSSVAGSGGHGLVGVCERARLFGGTASAGPVSGGGFRVQATLPLVQEDQCHSAS